ncbi:TylF/MycF/NovP-related O-methyltransferase [Actinomadura kijaniata]|uniref:Sugar-O-methyltransferase n=1 Tax=Actinomadura kijaniata TaxID=46161 RepID=B3TMN3_ACTKI|nr:TylF/MycF/NovP-related O-methyltransferase [Actinomadura kijaniata]ACB46463.1 sugar-O-methyltransferase [Actinomadura kijaniata]
MATKDTPDERKKPAPEISNPTELADAYLGLLKKCLLRFHDGAAFPYSPDSDPVDARMSTLLSKGIMPSPGADTMVSQERLDNIHHAAATVIREGVPGDFIETGVWRGGSCILMRAALTAYGDRTRKVWVADSFDGFPPPTDKYPSDPWQGRSQDIIGTLGVSLKVTFEEVKERFARYGLLDERVEFLTGFFEHTLPSAPIDRLAILRLDGDLYQSTYEALEALYPKLSVGGYCIIDDYFYTMCSKAVDDYRRKHNIDEPIEAVDWTCVQWRKAG